MSIIVKELSKIYGSGENRVTALDRASMEICDRDFISIVGPSGSGKSTLLHLISGLDRPTSGTVLYDGKDIHSGSDRVLSAFRRRNIGFIFQQFNLLPVLTARENIMMPLLLDRRRPDETDLNRIAGLLGIAGRLDHLRRHIKPIHLSPSFRFLSFIKPYSTRLVKGSYHVTRMSTLRSCGMGLCLRI